MRRCGAAGISVKIDPMVALSADWLLRAAAAGTHSASSSSDQICR